MKKEPKPELPVEPEPAEVVAPVKDMSNFILVGCYARGLDNKKFDNIKVHYLWEGNYRVNCFIGPHIKESYFVRYSEDEGILWSEPHLPLAKEGV